MVTLEKAPAPRTVETTRLTGTIHPDDRSDMMYALLSNDLDALWTYFLWAHEGDARMERSRTTIEEGWESTPLEQV